METLLLIDEVLALRLERGGLGLDRLERIGERRQEVEGRVRVDNEGVEVALGQLQLVFVDAFNMVSRASVGGTEG